MPIDAILIVISEYQTSGHVVCVNNAILRKCQQKHQNPIYIWFFLQVNNEETNKRIAI